MSGQYNLASVKYGMSSELRNEHYGTRRSMEKSVELSPLSEDAASLLWLESEALDLDLFNFPLYDAEDNDAASSASPLTADSPTETEDSNSDVLRVVVPFNKQSKSPDAANTASVRRLSYRQRQKQDLQMLRAHVADLEHELRFLQSAASMKAHTGTSSTGSPPIGMSTDSSGWQLVAKQQFLARELAEEENKILRQTLQERICMAKSLERVLLQHEMIRSVRWCA